MTGNDVVLAIKDTINIADEQFSCMFDTNRDRVNEIIEAASLLDQMVSEFSADWVEAEVIEGTTNLSVKITFREPPYFEETHGFWRVLSIANAMKTERDPDGDQLLVSIMFCGIWSARK